MTWLKVSLKTKIFATFSIETPKHSEIFIFVLFANCGTFLEGLAGLNRRKVLFAQSETGMARLKMVSGITFMLHCLQPDLQKKNLVFALSRNRRTKHNIQEKYVCVCVLQINTENAEDEIREAFKVFDGVSIIYPWQQQQQQQQHLYIRTPITTTTITLGVLVTQTK